PKACSPLLTSQRLYIGDLGLPTVEGRTLKLVDMPSASKDLLSSIAKAEDMARVECRLLDGIWSSRTLESEAWALITGEQRSLELQKLAIKGATFYSNVLEPPDMNLAKGSSNLMRW